MQFLKVDSDATFSDLRDRVGSRNVNEYLFVNSLDRKPNIGQILSKKFSDAVQNTPEVDWQKKSTILNKFSGDSDIFEMLALAGQNTWKSLVGAGAIPGTVKVPETIKLPDSADVIGNGVPVPKSMYEKVMSQITHPPHEIEASVFNEFSARAGLSAGQRVVPETNDNFFHMFNIPWGEITLYSSFGDEINVPVYPEQVEDGVGADYAQMPDLIYQYEPWLVYQSSGPRTVTYDFHMHRDMWTGDHSDGKCNELIRTCEAQCYAKYQGSSVQTPIVSLYIAGKELITGIMLSTKTSWSGPILNDGWYAEVTLSISITEVSRYALSYDVIKSKGVIG